MVEALLHILPLDIVDRIADLVPRRPEVEWETLYGSTTIYETKHFLTYGGGPEGGFVYFYRERAAGWYRWERDWGTEPTYTKIRSGRVATAWIDDVEKIGILPDDDYDWDEDEDYDVMILYDELMQDRDRNRDD
jgi:hypothetical protein